MAKRVLSMTGIAVVVLIVLAACGAPKDDTGFEPTVTRIASPVNYPVVTATTEEGAPTAAPTAAGSPEAADNGASDGEQVVTITAHDIYFEPSEVHVKAGKVTFDLPNEGAAEHDFSIDALGVQVNMPSGTTQTVEVDVPAGSYEFYCNIPGHKDAGMVGTLIAE